jgi:hypothetical protein
MLAVFVVAFSSNIWCIAFPENEVKEPKMVSLAGRACHVVNGELKPIDPSLPFDVRYDAVKGKFINQQNDSKFFQFAFCVTGLIGMGIVGIAACDKLYKLNPQDDGIQLAMKIMCTYFMVSLVSLTLF